MISKNLAIIVVAFSMCSHAVLAQETIEEILPLNGHIAVDGLAVELDWFDAERIRIGAVEVNRRTFGQTGGRSWQSISPELDPVMRFIDDTIALGTAYEYQVLRTGRDTVEAGYWVAGRKVPALEFRGIVHLVIDETVAQDIAPRLNRFEQDLVGDGWTVLRHIAPRGDTRDPLANVERAAALKATIREAYFVDPFNQHTIVLLGHVPIVRSGHANPDGHDAVAHATDLFYAEMDGQWRVNSEGVLLHNQVPSDFIEMQVGRIDFSSISNGDRNLELHLLRSYFDKNHHWRHKLLGDLRTAYGQTSFLEVERAGLRNIVGPASVTEGGHHDVGEEKPWLWGVGFGDWDAMRYAADFSNRAVFTINFGSGKQKIGVSKNAMVALLAQPWYTIATGWGARPAWWLHLMSLGGTIGETHMRTVNNGRSDQPYRQSMDYYPTGEYLWRNPIWVNLLGDPTTHAFPLSPPARVKLENSERGTRVSWTASPDPDVIGYKIYRTSIDSLNFKPLTDAILDETTFMDSAPEENSRYMVRAYGLRQVYAGSFYTFSQGVFSQETALSEIDFQTKMTLSSSAGLPVRFPDTFAADADTSIYAVIEAPEIGQLLHDGTNWLYMPPAEFAGMVQVRFSASIDMQTEEGLLTFVIRNPN